MFFYSFSQTGDDKIVSFVRLAKATHFGDLTEVPIPTRFLFILLGAKQKIPAQSGRYHEIGRSIATLMSDEVRQKHAHCSCQMRWDRSTLMSDEVRQTHVHVRWGKKEALSCQMRWDKKRAKFYVRWGETGMLMLDEWERGTRWGETKVCILMSEERPYQMRWKWGTFMYDNMKIYGSFEWQRSADFKYWGFSYILIVYGKKCHW